VKESDFKLEKRNKKFREFLRTIDSYSIEKAQAEILLSKSSYKYVALRLPDVVGPFDETKRFWKTYICAKCSDIVPFEIDEEMKTLPMSFVYSKDVASFILQLVKNRSQVSESLVFNMCSEVCKNYQELIENIEEGVKFVEKSTASSFYPSVSCGPLCNEKLL
jgi:nucleoside-diphosphate-sugar epimerase